MIKTDNNGLTYGLRFECPICKKDHGDHYYHITEQLPILCDDCLNNDNTPVNLRINTLIFYVRGLQTSTDDIQRVTSGLRMIT
jgi:hypothetical protein